MFKVSIILWITIFVTTCYSQESYFNNRFSNASITYPIKSFENNLFKTDLKLDRLNRDTVLNFDKTTEKCIICPTNKNFTNIVSLTTLTGLLIFTDPISWNFTNNQYKKSSFSKKMFDKSVDIGDGKTTVAISGLFLTYGLLGNSYRARTTSLEIMESLLISGITVQALKRIFGRESPAATSTKSGDWHFFPNLHEYGKHQPKYYAFPSGHITTITSTLTVIANNYPEYKWIKPVSYCLIGLTGVGLVAKKMHWYSDLPFGILLGNAFGNLISSSHKKNSTEKLDESNPEGVFNVSPYISGFHNGLQLSYSF